jgi:DNA invertase Pin-like site-specific DNA recombinase
LAAAVGIVRVSRSGGREGESFASPAEQRQRIEAACERDGLELLVVHEELDVSGGTPLEQREGLRQALEAVEAGRAQVIMVAYFDRLVRSLRVQAEVVSRVEAAGGRVVALDIGEVTEATASKWLSGTMLGAIAEYYRRSVSERVRAAQAQAVARGVMPSPQVVPGYRRRDDGRLEPDPDTADAIREAFTLRADSATVRAVRDHLAAHGVKRSYAGTRDLLSSRVYLGEIHFGQLSNLEAHEPLIESELWRAVQRVKVSRGRQAKSERLLARLGVLRCGTCNGPMAVSTSSSPSGVYRCSPLSDCPQRMAVSARIAEQVVVDAARREFEAVEGRASAERDAREAVAAAERAQAELDTAIRTLAGIEDELAARERIKELRDARDAAREEAHRLSGLSASFTVNIAERWNELTLAEQRTAIRLTVDRAVVEPGRGAGRIRVETVREHPSRD